MAGAGILSVMNCLWGKSLTEFHNLLHDRGEFISYSEFLDRYEDSIDYISYFGVFSAILSRKSEDFVQGVGCLQSAQIPKTVT